MTRIDNDIKKQTDDIATIKEGINTRGSNFGNLYTLQKEIGKLDKLRQERKDLDKLLEEINYDIKNYTNNIDEMKKYNIELN